MKLKKILAAFVVSSALVSAVAICAGARYVNYGNDYRSDYQTFGSYYTGDYSRLSYYPYYGAITATDDDYVEHYKFVTYTVYEKYGNTYYLMDTDTQGGSTERTYVAVPYINMSSLAKRFYFAQIRSQSSPSGGTVSDHYVVNVIKPLNE